MIEEKQKELEEILLMPIEKKKGISGFYIENGTIYTSQKYKGQFDYDMSNVAVVFYSILYSLNPDEIFNNDEFKGDTMNSSLKYYKSSLEKKNMWNKQRHCLANFWILPKDIGRTVKGLTSEQKKYCKHSKESKLHDYMDNFLSFMPNNLGYYFSNHKEYFDKLSIHKDNFLEDMSSVHYLEDGYIIQNRVLKIDKNIKDGVYDDWNNRLNQRAHLISHSDKWKELYDALTKYKN